MKPFKQFFETYGKRLPLRQRIALLNAGAILVLCILLALFINLAAPLFFSYGIGLPNTYRLIQGTDAAGLPVTIIAETPGPSGYTVQESQAPLPGDPLVTVRYLSIAGVVLTGILGFFATQW